MDYPQRGSQKTYTYVWVRKDMPLHYQVIQAGHALHEIGLQQADNRGENNIVLFEVPDQEVLEAVSNFLRGLGMRHHMFFEPDYGTGHSAIATRLVHEEEKVREQFRDFPLWKWEQEKFKFWDITTQSWKPLTEWK